MSGGASPPDWARMGGFITETELGEPQRQAPQSTLTDEERARASRLKLRNALQGGHAEVALALLDGSDGGTLAQADLNEDGRLPLHIALDREPDALGVTANSVPICVLGKLHPKAAKAGDPKRSKALPLHICLEMGHEDVVVWCAAHISTRAAPATSAPPLSRHSHTHRTPPFPFPVRRRPFLPASDAYRHCLLRHSHTTLRPMAHAMTAPISAFGFGVARSRSQGRAVASPGGSCGRLPSWRGPAAASDRPRAPPQRGHRG